jgi:iron(III) transport system substrate-binding protein
VRLWLDADGEQALARNQCLPDKLYPEDIAAMVEAFNGEYPDTEVEVFRSGTEEVLSRARAEHDNDALGGDVFLIADAVSMVALREEGMLQPYTSPEADDIPEEFVDPQDHYTGTKLISTGIAYNTDAVQAAPESWTDLAQAEGVVMPSPLYSGAAAYNVTLMSQDDAFGWSFWEDLAPQATVVEGNGAVLDGVASGDHDYGMIVDFMAVRAAAEGSPVDFAYPDEGVPVITEPIALSAAGADNPDAEAFIDFVLGSRGQAVAADLGYVPIRPDADPPEGLLGVSELPVMDGDTDALAARIEDAKEDFAELYGDG